MRLNPPTVLLDRTFLEALTDVEHQQHESAVAVYGDLIDQFEADRNLLAALSIHLDAMPKELRRTLLAPVTTLHVGGQHRRAAAKVGPPAGSDPDLALVLVLVRRERIRTVATFDPRLAEFDLELLSGAPTPN